MGLELNVSQCIITIIFHIIALIIFGNILYRRHRKKLSANLEISPSMLFYFVSQIITSVVTIIYAAYYIIVCFRWAQLFNAYIWFYIFNLQKIVFISLPVSVFAIGLDRCFCILYPMKYKRNIISVLIALIIILAFLLYSIFYIAPMMYPNCAELDCSKYSGSDIYINVRYFTSALILIVCLIMLYLFHKKTHIHLAKNVTGRSNKIILSTLLTTLVLDFLPHICISIASQLTVIHLVLIMGPFSSTIGSIEALICALLYNRIFRKTPTKKPTFVLSVKTYNY